MALTIIDLSKQVKKILAVVNGGTGKASLGLNNILIGNGTGAVAELAPTADGDVVKSSGGLFVSGPASGASVPQRPTAGFTVASNTQVLFFSNLDMTVANGDLVINGLLQGVH